LRVIFISPQLINDAILESQFFKEYGITWTLRVDVLFMSRTEGFKNNGLFSLQDVRKPEAAPEVQQKTLSLTFLMNIYFL
jgi:hypothetical protein